MDSDLKIGKFHLLHQVGVGGMAEVFKATQTLDDGSVQTVAIKRLFPHLAADREFVRMFVNEASIASSMEHPNIVRTHDLINFGSYYYIVMDFVDGPDLEELVSMAPPGRMTMSLDEIAYIIHEVSLGLEYAHKGGARPGTGPVVHRDISPGNIMIDGQGKVQITDFGIARATQYAQATQPGTLKGKYDYMAPEYIQGNAFDGRADLFSLGVVFYELLTGENPFSETLPLDIWEKIVHSEPRAPSKISPGVPKGIDRLIEKAMKKDPNRRIRSGSVFAEMLRPFVGPSAKKRLGARVASAKKQFGRGEPSAGISDFSRQASLYKEEDTDKTKEMHLDDLLELVDPLDVPRPDFLAATGKSPVNAENTDKMFFKRTPWVCLAGIVFVLLMISIWLALAHSSSSSGLFSVYSDLRAEVFINGKRRGKTPLVNLELPEGRHRIEVRLRRSKKTKKYRRLISAGKRYRLLVKWKPGRRKPREAKKKHKLRKKKR
jgi:serine/threonine protein kinase